MKKNNYLFIILITLLPFASWAQFSGGVGRGAISSSLNDKHLTNWFNTAGAWSSTGNWLDGVLPSSTENANIAAAAVIDANYSHPAVNIAATGSATISPGKNLTVTGTLTNAAGNSGLIIKSNATGTGSLKHNTSGVPATIERYITGNSSLTQFSYHQVAVPIESDALTASIFAGSYLYRFDAGSQEWVGLGSNGSTALDKNQGYMIYYPNNATTYSFAGNLRNGSITLLSSAGAKNNHFLVPNPYPSAIDWNAGSGWTKTNLYDAIWIWNPVAKNYAAYGSEAGTNGATRYIPQGQAFFVRAEAAGATLALNNDVRVHSNQAFFKEGNEVPNLLRITANSNGCSDEMIVRFRTDASSLSDDFDVAKMNGDEQAPQLSTRAGDELLSINSLPVSENQTMVPMNFETQFTGQVSISASGLDSFASSAGIYLTDELTNQTINLRNQPVYTFSHNPENAANRFKLVFGGTIGIEEQTNETGKLWIAGNKLYVCAPELSGEPAVIEVFNPSGQKLFYTSLCLDELTSIDLETRGFVIVRLTSGQKVMTAKGILMK